MRVTLRDYQSKGIDGARDKFVEGFRAVMLTAPTGAGKTIMFSWMTERAAARGKTVMILVHRQELLRQTSRQLDELGIDHSLIARGMHFDKRHQVHVASVQTLARRLDAMPSYSPDLIIIDEAHHVTRGNTWGNVLDHYGDAKVLGVTATPERLDGKGLGVHAHGFFETLVYGPSVQHLIDNGYLSKVALFAPNVVDASGVGNQGGDFNRKQLSEVMTAAQIYGDVIKHYRQHLAGAPSIAFCVSVDHAEMVAEQFKQAGYQSASIDGKMDDATRASRIKDLGNGTLNVLTSCEIISEGTDIPVVAGAILLRHTRSLGMYLQQVGRALRVYPGKERAVILDHVGNVFRHGMPQDDREWSLDGKKGRQQKGDDDEVKGMETRQCPKCYFVHKIAPFCPSCGHKYAVTARQIEEIEGELQEISKIELKRDKKRQVAQARTLEELEVIEKQRGYKPGWARLVLKGRGQPVPSRKSA